MTKWNCIILLQKTQLAIHHSTLAEQNRCLKLDKPKENVCELMIHAIIGYNNSIHSVTGYTPFEVMKSHINTSDPFERGANT